MLFLLSFHHSDDFEDLLDKIGHQEDVKIQVKEKTDVVNEGNMSVLDDIFSSSDKQVPVILQLPPFLALYL
jgi:hypothetical protein